MNKILAASLLAAAGLASTSAVAADSYSLSVSATVLGRCVFTQAVGQTLTLTNTLGGIDPSSATNATGNATITYKCTKGQAPAFSANTGANDGGTGTNRVSDGTNFMVYTLGLTSGGAGTGFGAAENKTLTVAGTIVPAQFQNAAVGTYSDTVTINVTP